MFKALAKGSESGLGVEYQVQVFAITLPYTVEDLYVESRTNMTLNNILGLSSVVFKDSRRVENHRG